MSQDSPKKKSDPEPDHVRSEIEPATREGLAILIKKANKMLEENPDFRLLTVVRLEKAIATVYVRVAKGGRKITEFWEEDDVEA